MLVLKGFIIFCELNKTEFYLITTIGYLVLIFY